MIDEYLLKHPSYKYAVDVVNNKYESGKYIHKECNRFLEELENEDSPYFLDINMLKKIDGLTGLINMADGHRAGTPVRDSLADFQWYFLVNALCWKHKDNPEKRRYEKSVLLIARKSGKDLPSYIVIYNRNRGKSVELSSRQYRDNLNLKKFEHCRA